MPAPFGTFGPLLAVAALMAFVVYRRARQSIGRQRLRPKRFTARMILLGVAAIGFLVAMPLNNVVYAALGALVGVGIAIYGLSLTTMERTEEGTFYKANAYIGLAVTALLVGRVLYRFVTMYGAMQTATAHASEHTPMAVNPFAGTLGNPLTLAAFFVMLGYYVVFYGGLLRKAKKLPDEGPSFSNTPSP